MDYQQSWQNYLKQHQKIDVLLKELAIAAENPLDFDAIDQAISDVLAYVKQHFHDEEKLMAALNYPKLIEHQQLHLDWLTEVEKLCFSANLTTDPVMALNEKLIQLKQQHIVESDADFERFVAEKKPELIQF